MKAQYESPVMHRLDVIPTHFLCVSTPAAPSGKPTEFDEEETM